MCVCEWCGLTCVGVTARRSTWMSQHKGAVSCGRRLTQESSASLSSHRARRRTSSSLPGGGPGSMHSQVGLMRQ